MGDISCILTCEIWLQVRFCFGQTIVHACPTSCAGDLFSSYAISFIQQQEYRVASQRLLMVLHKSKYIHKYQRWLQVSRVTRTHHVTYAYWMQPSEARVT